MNEATQPADNPIYEHLECSKCKFPLMAKNTTTGQEVCNNQECQNYNPEILKQLLISPCSTPAFFTENKVSNSI